MKKQNIKASLTSREMEAIASMLLSNNGINIDPIIEDLYPTINDDAKSVFRCKMALLLSGKLPEFKPFEGYYRDNSRKILKYRCISESSLMGVRNYEVVEIWRKEKDTETWTQDTTDEYNEVGSVRTDSWDLTLYPSLDEAEKNW